MIGENNNDGLNACDDENLKVSRNVVRVGETPSTESGLESFDGRRNRRCGFN